MLSPTKTLSKEQPFWDSKQILPALKNTQVESKNKPQEKGLILQLQIYAHQGSEYQRIPPYQGEFVVVRCGDHQYTKDKGHSKIERNLLPQDQYYGKRTVKSSSQIKKKIKGKEDEKLVAAKPKVSREMTALTQHNWGG